MERKPKLLKKDKFMKERQDIINKLDKILGLDENNRTIILYYLQNDEKKIEDIKELAKMVMFYFSVSEWSYYKNKKKDVRNRELSLIKSIYKDSGYEIKKKLKPVLEGDIKIMSIEYEIIKKT
jgi:hypothetical protein